ncbi:Alpha/Beta hydrolase protein [Lentinula raphanica]|nr:Alpha/Beta hydrolase protein [Lentinula raphanica]
MDDQTETNNKRALNLNWANYLSIAYLITVRLPFVLLKTVLSPLLHPANTYNDKPLKRRIGDALMREAPEHLPESVMLRMVGTGLEQYRQFVSKYQPELGMTVEDLPLAYNDGRGEKAQLFWIGPRRTEKVILYFPGGAYVYPVIDMMLKFWRYAQMQWKRQGLEVGIVVLSYSVGYSADAAFPIQLFQATQAVNLLLSQGCKPSDIQIVGDSAGGNLVAQLLSHMVHPLPLPSLVPPLNLPPGTRFRGVYMLSPWLSFSNPNQWGSSVQTKNSDVAPSYQKLRSSGGHYLNSVSNIGIPYELSELIPYIEPVLAPDSWFSGLQNTVVERVLMTAGMEERLLNQIEVFFNRKLKPHHSDAVLLVQNGGLHDDIIMDFFVAEAPLDNDLTPVVLDWLAEGFRM